MRPSDDTAQPDADPLLGKVLSGRFKILEPLGSGGMGRVYKALQTPLGRLVALKVLNPTYEGGKDPGFQKRFFLEASLTAKLHHPNTITVHDYGKTDEGIYFIAMEFVEGVTLQQLLAKAGPLPWPRVMHISQQICRSLREAHKLGLVHRDLKPANVMVLTEETDNDIVKVLDFGLVKPFMPEEAPKPVDQTELTQAGVLLGSPLYMAPELARNMADPRTDIYSLGVVMYQMLAGRTPFQGRESIDVIIKHLREEPPPLRSVQPELPVEVDALVMRCLNKAPDHRFQSMDEVLVGLREAATATGLSGAWSRGRTLSLSGAYATGPTPAGSATSASRALSQIEVAIPADYGPPPRKGPTRKLALVVAGASLAVGAALAVVWSRGQATEKPAVVPDEPVAPRVVPRPTPTRAVVFRVTSEPPGATAHANGQKVGVTPCDVELTARPGEDASAELVLELEGHRPQRFGVSGPGPLVLVHRTLERNPLPAASPKPKPKTKPEPPKVSPGYKEDPYR